MPKKSKGNNVVIRLVDPNDPRSSYNTVKNKKSSPEKFQMNKYNKYSRKHTLHVEVKQFIMAFFENIKSFLSDLENYKISSNDDLLSFKKEYGILLKNLLEEYKQLSVDLKRQNSALIGNFQ